jgi:antitoxin component YwqK of YwqJK toxin-antitoxin module
MYKDDLKAGKWKFYDDRGSIFKEQEFENGQPTGKWVEYYQNGIKKAEGSYKGIYKHGKWTYYDAAGKIVYQVLYKKGTRVKEIINTRNTLPKN